MRPDTQDADMRRHGSEPRNCDTEGKGFALNRRKVKGTGRDTTGVAANRQGAERNGLATIWQGKDRIRNGKATATHGADQKRKSLEPSCCATAKT